FSHIAEHRRIAGRNRRDVGQRFGTDEFQSYHPLSAIIATGIELLVDRNMIVAASRAIFERAKRKCAFAKTRLLDQNFVVADWEMRMQECNPETAVRAFGDQQFSNFVEAGTINV